MRATSERRTPGFPKSAQDRVQDVFHIFPYHLVAERAKEHSRVLEVGFGEGYGSEILAPVIGEYVGLDVAKEAAEHANAHHGKKNVHFQVYDGTTMPFADESFDIIISFHVLEHLTDPGSFVGELRRVCRRGGRTVLVTPNAAFRLAPGERPWSRFHVREFTSGELMGLLTQHFFDSAIEIKGIAGSNAMNELERDRVMRARRLAKLDPLGLRYRFPEAFMLPLRRLLMSTPHGRSAASGEPSFSLADVHVVECLDDAPHLIAIAEH